MFFSAADISRQGVHRSPQVGKGGGKSACGGQRGRCPVTCIGARPKLHLPRVNVPRVGSFLSLRDVPVVTRPGAAKRVSECVAPVVPDRAVRAVCKLAAPQPILQEKPQESGQDRSHPCVKMRHSLVTTAEARRGVWTRYTATSRQ